MSLLAHLRASAGERNLRNALGRWRQLVSQALDGGAAAPDYIQVRRIGAPQPVGPGPTDLVFDQVWLQRGIQYNTGTGIFTLEIGKIYMARAVVAFGGWGAPPADAFLVAWTDLLTNFPFPMFARVISPANADIAMVSQQPVCEAIIDLSGPLVPPNNTDFVVRATPTPPGTAVMSPTLVSATIIQIPNG